MHGTRVEVRLVDMGLDEACNDNILHVEDNSGKGIDSELAPPGRTARCGQSTFPPASQVLTSDGVVTVTFKSRRNSGKSRFRLMVTGAVPKACPGKWNAQGCPNGPCCSGKDCCIIQAGKEPKG